MWLGEEGAATTAKPGALAIECSTVSHQHALDLAAATCAQRGLIYIDCPVTGLPDAAASGKLTLLVGAEPADLERARPYLAPLGTTIRHFGAVGTGTVYKLINNLMGAIQIAGLAEGLAIAEQAGLDMELVLEVDRRSGVVASPQVIRHAPRMVARNFADATFTAALRHKDAAYARGAGRKPAARRAGRPRRGCGLCRGQGRGARRRRGQDDRDRLVAEGTNPPASRTPARKNFCGSTASPSIRVS